MGVAVLLLAAVGIIYASLPVLFAAVLATA